MAATAQPRCAACGHTRRAGFYHDGRYATLAEVVEHYNATFHLGLSAQEIGDVVEYLKSIEEQQAEAADRQLAGPTAFGGRSWLARLDCKTGVP